MPYTDFTPDSVATVLGVTPGLADLFPGLVPAAVPDWLTDTLARGRQAAAIVSEKARGEFIVVPILPAARQLVPGPVAIYSGQRLDVDADRGLVGECDYLVAATEPVPALRPPVLVVLEAKKHDVESGVWQCFAQMAGARLYNDRAGRPAAAVYGCVTNGDVWQFLRLTADAAGIDRERYYLGDVGSILAALGAVIGAAPGKDSP